MLRAAPNKDELVVTCCNAMNNIAGIEKRIDRPSTYVLCSGLSTVVLTTVLTTRFRIALFQPA